jgi:methane monooxygenase component D
VAQTHDDSTRPADVCSSLDGDEAPPTLIHSDERYCAYASDLQYMWRWEILRNGEFVQEGCSLSERAAKEAVAHVISYFRSQDASRGTEGDKTDAIQNLLNGIGVARPIDAAD